MHIKKHLLWQVHEVDGGDHGLAVHAGKQSKSKTEEALQQIASATCDFARMLEQKYLAGLAVNEGHQQSASTCNKRKSGTAAASSNTPADQELSVAQKAKKTKVNP